MLPKLTIEYSLEREIARVHDALHEIEWFRERQYPLILPQPLTDTDAGDMTAITNAVTADFDETKYLSISQTVLEEWQKVEATCEHSPFEIFPELSREITVRLTRYGVGGSYHVPQTIVTNIELQRQSELLKTLLHEITHLGLRTLVEEDDLDHWTKEHVVDRITVYLNPTYGHLQPVPIDTSKIDAVFDVKFPDMQAIAQELQVTGPAST